MKRWPNFFVIGEARSGTTSLYEYLKNTKGIFLPIKEINYFSPNINPKLLLTKSITNEKNYLELYNSVKDESAIGDVSPLYLWDSKINLLIILSSITIAILAIIIGPIFIEELFPKYSDGIQSLQILVISIIPLTISSIINAKLQAKESALVGYSAIVRIGTLLILIPILGGMFDLIGLSISVLLCLLFVMLFFY